MQEGSPDKDIIAQILSIYKAEDLLIVSNDATMRVNARSFGISAKKLSVSLDNEPVSAEKTKEKDDSEKNDSKETHK